MVNPVKTRGHGYVQRGGDDDPKPKGEKKAQGQRAAQAQEPPAPAGGDKFAAERAKASAMLEARRISIDEFDTAMEDIDIREAQSKIPRAKTEGGEEAPPLELPTKGDAVNVASTTAKAAVIAARTKQAGEVLAKGANLTEKVAPKVATMMARANEAQKIGKLGKAIGWTKLAGATTRGAKVASGASKGVGVAVKAAGRVTRGLNIAVAIADVYVAAQDFKDPKASLAKRIASGVTAALSITAAATAFLPIPFVSEAIGVASLGTSLLRMFL